MQLSSLPRGVCRCLAGSSAGALRGPRHAPKAEEVLLSKRRRARSTKCTAIGEEGEVSGVRSQKALEQLRPESFRPGMRPRLHRKHTAAGTRELVTANHGPPRANAPEADASEANAAETPRPKGCATLRVGNATTARERQAAPAASAAGSRSQGVSPLKGKDKDEAGKATSWGFPGGRFRMGR